MEESSTVTGPQSDSNLRATPLSPSPESNLHRAIFLGIFLFLVLALTAYGTYWYTKNYLVTPSSQSTTSNVIPETSQTKSSFGSLNNHSTSAATNETANWKTYTPIDKSFMFEYPDDWTVQPDQVFGSRTVTEFRFQQNSPLELAIIGNYNQVAGESYRNLEDYIGQRKDRSQDFSLAGQPAKRIVDLGEPGHVVPYEEVLAFSIDKRFVISLYFKPDYYPPSHGIRAFDQILSTFKFLDEKETISEAQAITIPKDWTEFTASDPDFGVKTTLFLPPGNHFRFTGSEWILGSYENKDDWEYKTSVFRGRGAETENYYAGGSRRDWYQRYLNEEFSGNTPAFKRGEIVSVSEHPLGTSSYLEVSVRPTGGTSLEKHYLYIQNMILQVIKPNFVEYEKSLIAKNIGTIFFSLKSVQTK